MGDTDLRDQFFLSPSGIHWDELEEDISIEGFLAGRGDQTKASKRATE